MGFSIRGLKVVNQLSVDIAAGGRAEELQPSVAGIQLNWKLVRIGQKRRRLDSIMQLQEVGDIQKDQTLW